MAVSVMKFLTIKASATEYKLLCFRFGGGEFFEGKGYSLFDYIAGIIVGPNPALLIDRVDGAGRHSVEKAGFYNYEDLTVAWEYILRHFGSLPENSVMNLEQNADKDFMVKSVELVEGR